MKARLITASLLGLAMAAAGVPAHAQDPSPAPQSSPQSQDSGGGQQGHRGGRGQWGGGMMGGARGLMGTVTAVAADHYSIKTETGEVYTVYFSANTRVMKQRVRQRQGGGQSGSESGGPEFLKPADIKVGDVIAAGGQLDASAKTVGAVFVVQIDPERARQMQQMEANYGKTWLMGRVTAIDGVKVTLEGIRDKKTYVFAADENTTFRHRRDPITLADVHVGDLVRVEGGLKDGIFLAATVTDAGTPQETRMPRAPGTAPDAPAPDAPSPDAPPQ